MSQHGRVTVDTLANEHSPGSLVDPDGDIAKFLLIRGAIQLKSPVPPSGDSLPSRSRRLTSTIVFIYTTTATQSWAKYQEVILVTSKFCSICARCCHSQALWSFLRAAWVHRDELGRLRWGGWFAAQQRKLCTAGGGGCRLRKRIPQILTAYWPSMSFLLSATTGERYLLNLESIVASVCIVAQASSSN